MTQYRRTRLVLDTVQAQSKYDTDSPDWVLTKSWQHPDCLGGLQKKSRKVLNSWDQAQTVQKGSDSVYIGSRKTGLGQPVQNEFIQGPNSLEWDQIESRWVSDKVLTGSRNLNRVQTQHIQVTDRVQAQSWQNSSSNFLFFCLGLCWSFELSLGLILWFPLLLLLLL